MRKKISLTAIAALVAIGISFAGKPFYNIYEDANGNPVLESYYDHCGNSTQTLCCTHVINGVVVGTRNTPNFNP